MSITKGSAEPSPDPDQGREAHNPSEQLELLCDQGPAHLRLAYSASEATTLVIQARREKGLAGMQSKRTQGLLDRSVQAQIGRMLRDLFSDAAEEPVPERFVKLLEALETEEGRR